MYRQGDISLHRVETKPNGLKKTKDNILAYGEISDHRHWLNAPTICVLEDSIGNRYAELTQDTELIHSDSSLQPIYDKNIAQKQDKHLALIIKKGFYAIKQEREFNIFDEEIRQVLD